MGEMPREKLLAFLEQAKVTIAHQLSRNSADQGWYRRRFQKTNEPELAARADFVQKQILTLKRQYSAISAAIGILSHTDALITPPAADTCPMASADVKRSDNMDLLKVPTDEILHHILETEAKASKPPWSVDEGEVEPGVWYRHVDGWTDEGAEVCDDEWLVLKREDAQLIAETRNLIRPLIEEVLRQRAIVKEEERANG